MAGRASTLTHIIICFDYCQDAIFVDAAESRAGRSDRQVHLQWLTDRGSSDFAKSYLHVEVDCCGRCSTRSSSFPQRPELVSKPLAT